MRIIFLLNFILITHLLCNAQQLSSLNKKASLYRNSYRDSAKVFSKLAKEEALKNSDDFNSISSDLINAFICYNQSEFALAEKYVLNAEQNKKIGLYDTLSASLYFAKGVISFKLEKTEDALKFIRKSNQIALNSKNKNLYDSYLSNTLVIARHYQEKNDLQKAQSILNEIKREVENSKTKNIKSRYNHIQANLYGMKGEYQKAIQLDKESIAFAISNKLTPTPFYDNMAMCYSGIGKMDSSLFYFKKCIAVDSATKDYYLVADTYKNIAEFMCMQNDFTTAKKYLNTALAITKKINAVQFYLPIYKIFAKIAEEEKDFANALYYSKLYLKLNDSLLVVNNQSKVAEYKVLLDLDKKDYDLKLAEVKGEKKNNLLIFVSTLCLLIFASGVYITYKNKKSAEQKLQLQLAEEKNNLAKQVIAAEERERVRIAGDMHDGLGQLLSAIKFNVQGLYDKLSNRVDEKESQIFSKSIDLIDSSTKEIRNLSHNIMPNTLVKYGLASAVKEFVSAISNSRLEINLNVSGIQENLNEDLQIIIYRVIQESVNNIIKHAKANKLDISINYDAEGLALTIEDNGIGFNLSDIDSAKGIGLKNMEARVKYLKGSIEFDSKPGKGTLVSIFIPSIA